MRGRVCGDLAVSRAFGDSQYKGDSDSDSGEENGTNGAAPNKRKDMIIAEPDIVCQALAPGQDDFLLLACDGLWDVIDPQSAVDFVSECLRGEPFGSEEGKLKPHHVRNNPAKTGFALTQKAVYDLGTTDNTTIVLVQLRNDMTKPRKEAGDMDSPPPFLSEQEAQEEEEEEEGEEEAEEEEEAIGQLQEKERTDEQNQGEEEHLKEQHEAEQEQEQKRQPEAEQETTAPLPEQDIAIVQEPAASTPTRSCPTCGSLETGGKTVTITLQGPNLGFALGNEEKTNLLRVAIIEEGGEAERKGLQVYSVVLSIRGGTEVHQPSDTKDLRLLPFTEASEKITEILKKHLPIVLEVDPDM